MPKYYVKVDNRVTVWYKDAKMSVRHREDGPAVEYTGGNKMWYRDGKLHREDGPAVEYTSGNKIWYRYGNLHREDGPAIEYANGNKIWYRDGHRHREDGPAVEHADGFQEWWVDGIQQRSCGPAHKNAEIIQAWATGCKIQFLTDSQEPRWVDYTGPDSSSRNWGPWVDDKTQWQIAKPK